MPKNKDFWSWAIFCCSLGAYAPLIVGGWKHPYEMNIACFGLWVILAASTTWSSRIQGFAGWRMLLAFLVGNATVVVIALCRGGYTFNLGPSETIVLYGMSITIGAWVIVGATTKRWEPRILYLGGIAADVISFYPQMKQYLLPHEHPTHWMIFAWTMFGLGAFMNMILVEELPKKLRMDATAYGIRYDKSKNTWQILEESAFSGENFLLIVVTVILMCR